MPCTQTIFTYPCGHDREGPWEYCENARSVGLPFPGVKRAKEPCKDCVIQYAPGDLESPCGGRCLETPWRCCKCAGKDPKNTRVAWTCHECGHVRCFKIIVGCKTWKLCDCDCICPARVLGRQRLCERCFQRCAASQVGDLVDLSK